MKAPKTLLELKAETLWRAWLFEQMWLFSQQPTTGTMIAPRNLGRRER